MATIGGLNNFGLFENGDFRDGNVGQFTLGSFSSTEQFSSEGCVVVTGGGGSGFQGSQYIEVDTTKSYQMVVYAKTLQRGSGDGNLAGGYIGFSCYDHKKRFIRLEMCGGLGDTFLSRDLNPGDSFVYIEDISGWYQGSDVTNIRSVFRSIGLYPPQHPEFNTPHEYTRIGVRGGVNTIYFRSAVQTPQGDWKLELSDSNDNPTTWSYTEYPTPQGTPVSRGAAGGTYNYALGAPFFPETWTKFSTPIFTGESRNSDIPFRFATKYIRFLTLRNYRNRRNSPQDHVWALDNIFFGESVNGKDYSQIL